MTTKRIPAAVQHPQPGDAETDDLSIEYPDSDGEPMAENDYQFTVMTEIIHSLRQWYRDSPDVYVAGDMLVYYRMNDNRTRVAPDIFVVLGASGKHPRYSWLVWREGKAPDFVMEIASPGTWRRDIVEKRDIYEAMGVREYWRFDPTGECFTPRLGGERLADGEYRPVELPPEAGGILRGRSEVLGLDICAFPGPNLRLYHPPSGRWLRTHHEAEAALQEAEATLREEAAARQGAESALQRETAARQSAENELQRLREQMRALQPENPE